MRRHAYAGALCWLVLVPLLLFALMSIGRTVGLHWLLAFVPLENWQKSKLYDGLVLTVYSDELLAHLQPYAGDYLFAMEGYSLWLSCARASRASTIIRRISGRSTSSPSARTACAIGSFAGRASATPRIMTKC